MWRVSIVLISYSEGAMKMETDGQSMDVDHEDAVPKLAEALSEAPIEIIDVDDESKPSTSQVAQTQPIQVQPPPPAAPSYPGGFAIDVCFEASKLPLDVAIFNSARAAGGDEKIRKYLQAVLVIGGTALIPGMAHALESRLVVVPHSTAGIPLIP